MTRAAANAEDIRGRDIIDGSAINDYNGVVASITIRRLGDETKRRLRLRAASHGRSMEEEAREILRAAVCADPSPRPDLAAAIRARLEPLGGVELPEVPRDPIREPPGFA